MGWGGRGGGGGQKKKTAPHDFFVFDLCNLCDVQLGCELDVL